MSSSMTVGEVAWSYFPAVWFFLKVFRILNMDFFVHKINTHHISFLYYYFWRKKNFFKGIMSLVFLGLFSTQLYS